MTDEMNTFKVPVAQVERAVKLSYAQAMLGSIYGASVGGMFLIGYALKLGATNAQIGLMSTIPMLFVGIQLWASHMVESGVSRRLLTLIGSLGNVLGWVFIIMIPYVAKDAPPIVKVSALIAIITLVTINAYVSGNARGSWVGDLIPSNFRGTFFGRLTMYGGIIGTAFALIEGWFLDVVKSQGITAFSILFAFGVVVGLINALLFMPQADVPIERAAKEKGAFRGYVRDTFANKALIAVMIYALLWSLQSIAGPFYNTYMIRSVEEDGLGMPFLGIGIVNAMVTFTMLFFSPFWGRMVDRYGCRPILVLCTFGIAPFPLMWLAIPPGHATMVYALVGPLNLLGGFLIAGISVALSTLIYKVTPSAGRSVQFALYSIIVTIAAAPMPYLGGYLTDKLREILPWADLRVTFFAAMPFVIAAAFVARYIKEPDSRGTVELVRDLPAHLAPRKKLQPVGVAKEE
ncbi:MAG: MFS transporter [Armatimonadota bacterium]